MSDLRHTLPAILLVGGGGFVGSVFRYAVAVYAQRWGHNVPLGTLLANLVGCLLIGAFARMAAEGGLLSQHARLLLITGFCGGLTTMSTFAFETVALTQPGTMGFSILYVVATVAGSIGMVVLGSVIAGWCVSA